MDERDRPLLQERFVDEDHGPWKIVVVTQLLNRTSYKQVELVLDELFSLFGNPREMAQVTHAQREVLRRVLRPLGFNEQRARNLVMMSREYVADELAFHEVERLRDIQHWPGCGRYAQEAWRLLVRGEPCDPSDRRLRHYAERTGLLKT